MERDRQAEGGEIERQLGRKGRQWHNTGLQQTQSVLFHRAAEAESQTSAATRRSQNITCSLTAVGQLYTSFIPSPCSGPHHHHRPCGPVMELMLITVPGSLCSVYSCTGAERHAGKAADAERRVLVVTDGCAPSSLYLCIQAALCCPHSQ